MLIEFIRKNKDNWRELLSQEPYNLKFNECGKFTLVRYSQLSSDFSNPIVQESRGCIIDNETLEYACRPFVKFFNVSEELASPVDLDSARIQTKHDGSIIKCWWDGIGWRVSTNGTIDSSTAMIEGDFISFYELFNMAKGDLDFAKLNKNRTYIFELTSPLNRVVVDYKEHKIFHIGTIDNKTGEEFNEDIGIEKPKEFHCNNVDDIINAVNLMSYDEEGYVVVDKYWRRVKIKSPEYVRVHRLYSNVMTKRRAVEIIRMNEQSEFLAYFPQYKELFDGIEKAYNKLVDEVEIMLNNVDFSVDKKTLAILNRDNEFKDILFRKYDGKLNSVKEYFDYMYIDKLIKHIEDRM